MLNTLRVAVDLLQQPQDCLSPLKDGETELQQVLQRAQRLSCQQDMITLQ